VTAWSKDKGCKNYYSKEEEGLCTEVSALKVPQLKKELGGYGLEIKLLHNVRKPELVNMVIQARQEHLGLD